MRPSQDRLRLERLERLQEVTAALGAAASSNAVAGALERLALPLLRASAAAIFWERAPGELELVHAVGLDPAFATRRRVIRADERLPSADAYRTAAAVWVRTGAELRDRFPGLGPADGADLPGAFAAIPLATDRSRGTLALRFDEPRAFEAEERALVTAVATQCGLSMERARLHEAQRRQAERLRQIFSTTASLSGAATPGAVADAAFRGLAAIGAVAGELHALEAPDRLVRVARHGPDPEAEPDAPGAPAPAADVVRSGKALWLETPEAIDASFPNLEAGRRARGEGAWAVVPLLARGEPLGAISIAFPGPHRFDPDDRLFVRMLAVPCAQALERARLYEAAERIRREAQWSAATLDAMFASLPVGLGLLDRAMRYVRVNGRLARLNGLPVEAHLGRKPAELLPGLPGAQLAAAFGRVVEGGGAFEEVVVGELPSEPGATRRFRATWFAVSVAGEVVGAGVMVRQEGEG
ncbi:GAF domain-containing protein [Anaeromyxobacter dehalogenans]|uniref:Putative GAF sensor protein n=1 Tax=Anaeromyxobacter dehalogenans (strain 2CP-C) TaxID=290397 RepID=Q2IDY7_ANADE|nr:GAF domain-containing protein [Anaeromyxobacter dehalogenans]ABC82792.1 putative GAF sensor protein [Anaeromyxobacter dehalogenans 2CP-C]